MQEMWLQRERMPTQIIYIAIDQLKFLTMPVSSLAIECSLAKHILRACQRETKVSKYSSCCQIG